MYEEIYTHTHDHYIICVYVHNNEWLNNNLYSVVAWHGRAYTIKEVKDTHLYSFFLIELTLFTWEFYITKGISCEKEYEKKNADEI